MKLENKEIDGLSGTRLPGRSRTAVISINFYLVEGGEQSEKTEGEIRNTERNHSQDRTFLHYLYSLLYSGNSKAHYKHIRHLSREKKRSLSLSYAKKDWRAEASPILLWV